MVLSRKTRKPKKTLYKRAYPGQHCLNVTSLQSKAKGSWSIGN
jgi:hypothetical protein